MTRHLSHELRRAGPTLSAALVPPIVHEVLRSPGQPLDAPALASVEPVLARGLNQAHVASADALSFGRLEVNAPRDAKEQEAERVADSSGASSLSLSSPGLGFDFSRVRVHTDTRAAESALSLRARAYTAGEDIVFGAGQYAPTTSEGGRLLRHELVHVTQQARAARPALQRAPLRYAAQGFIFPVPTRPFTLADAQSLVDQKKKATPPELSGAAVKGAKPGTDEEIFLWYTIWQVGSRSQWGSEFDLIVPIGWPASVGGPAPIGKVTVSIDATGDAIAQLLSIGALAAPTTFTKLADADAKLKADYGIQGLKNDDATWTLEEANKLVGAFTLLPAGDRTALKGVVLLRVSSIDSGKTAGEFTNSASVEDTTVTSQATLKLADKAFAGESTKFVGSAEGPSPASYMTIVHEVGHAVATQAERAAALAHLQAVAKVNERVALLNEALGARNTATDEYNALVQEYNALVNTYNAAAKAKDPSTAQAKKDAAAKKKDLDAKRKEVDKFKNVEDAKKSSLDVARRDEAAKKTTAAATRIPATALSGLKADAATKKAGAATALKAAQTAAGGYAAKDASESQSYRSALESAATAIATYSTDAAVEDADFDDLESTAQAALDNRATERENLRSASPGNSALSDFAAFERAQDAWYTAERVLARAPQRTARVQKFVEFVNANKIVPFTEYAKENWPHKPEEFFAEAYSLWRTDPVYLKANAKALFDWFQTGKYK